MIIIFQTIHYTIKKRNNIVRLPQNETSEQICRKKEKNFPIVKELVLIFTLVPKNLAQKLATAFRARQFINSVLRICIKNKPPLTSEQLQRAPPITAKMTYSKKTDIIAHVSALVQRRRRRQLYTDLNRSFNRNRYELARFQNFGNRF